MPFRCLLRRELDAGSHVRCQPPLGSKLNGATRGGQALRASPETVETQADIAPQAADPSRPNPDAHAEPKACSGWDDVGEAVLNHRVPPDWERGVERLHRQPRPPGVLPHLWQLFLDDCDRFLDPRDGWAERAAALGWDAEALFGCDRRRPLDHPGAGLLWRVAGGRLTTIYREGATIEVDGKQRTFHRRRSAPNITLPWRLR